MKKIKFFMSIMEERDWLEEMATQGWLLTNLTMGIIYTFEAMEPCEKVYEIERFAISSHPTIEQLTAKSRAIDIASQFGWKVVTHDEQMNYYFVKDKANDETDEFYDDKASRLDRAERYRNFFAVEVPLNALKIDLLVTLLYMIVFLFTKNNPKVFTFFLTVYMLAIAIDLFLATQNMKWGQIFYTEFSMSREEWTVYKAHREKYKFKKVQQLRSYLQEKSASGLALKDYNANYYSFEKDTTRYNYFVDTRKNLKKRLKQNGQTLTRETKDLLDNSTSWYEHSIAEAAAYGLKPVVVIHKNVLVYKRPYDSEAALPWENGNENIAHYTPCGSALVFIIACLALGFVIGFCAAMFL